MVCLDDTLEYKWVLLKASLFLWKERHYFSQWNPQGFFCFPETSSFLLCLSYDNCVSKLFFFFKSFWLTVLGCKPTHFTATSGCSYVNVGDLNRSDLLICKLFLFLCSIQNISNTIDSLAVRFLLEESVQVLLFVVLKMLST